MTTLSFKAAEESVLHTLDTARNDAYRRLVEIPTDGAKKFRAEEVQLVGRKYEELCSLIEHIASQVNILECIKVMDRHTKYPACYRLNPGTNVSLDTLMRFIRVGDRSYSRFAVTMMAETCNTSPFRQGNQYLQNVMANQSSADISISLPLGSATTGPLRRYFEYIGSKLKLFRISAIHDGQAGSRDARIVFSVRTDLVTAFSDNFSGLITWSTVSRVDAGMMGDAIGSLRGRTATMEGIVHPYLLSDACILTNVYHTLARYAHGLRS